jgi:hypothetical protein
MITDYSTPKELYAETKEGPIKIIRTGTKTPLIVDGKTVWIDVVRMKEGDHVEANLYRDSEYSDLIKENVDVIIYSKFNPGKSKENYNG